MILKTERTTIIKSTTRSDMTTKHELADGLVSVAKARPKAYLATNTGMA